MKINKLQTSSSLYADAGLKALSDKEARTSTNKNDTETRESKKI